MGQVCRTHPTCCGYPLGIILKSSGPFWVTCVSAGRAAFATTAASSFFSFSSSPRFACLFAFYARSFLLFPFFLSWANPFPAQLMEPRPENGDGRKRRREGASSSSTPSSSELHSETGRGGCSEKKQRKKGGKVQELRRVRSEAVIGELCRHLKKVRGLAALCNEYDDVWREDIKQMTQWYSKLSRKANGLVEY